MKGEEVMSMFMGGCIVVALRAWCWSGRLAKLDLVELN